MYNSERAVLVVLGRGKNTCSTLESKELCTYFKYHT